MKKKVAGHFFCRLLLLFAFAVPVFAQESALLQEENAFYNNFALTSYSKERVEERLQEFYDLFGAYITNGFYVYSLTNDRYYISTDNIQDSTIAATSNERREELFYDNFRNLCYTKDAIGGVKTAIILGDHVRVGTEDYPYLHDGRSASTHELVEEAAAMARALGRPPATVEEARRIIGLA